MLKLFCPVSSTQNEPFKDHWWYNHVIVTSLHCVSITYVDFEPYIQTFEHLVDYCTYSADACLQQ